MKAVWKVLLVFAVLWALGVGTVGLAVLWNVSTALERLTREVEALRDPAQQAAVVRCPDGSIRIGGDPESLALARCQPLNLPPPRLSN